jgi:hypothetical protein
VIAEKSKGILHFLNVRGGTDDEYFLSGDLFQACRRKSFSSPLKREAPSRLLNI